MSTRRTTVAAVVAAAMAHSLSFSIAQADEPLPQTVSQLDIPAGTVQRALQLLARQADIQIAYAPESAAVDTPVVPLKGNYTTEQALRHILANTDLTFTTNAKDTVVIRKREAQSTEAGSVPSDKPLDTAATLDEVVVTAQKRSERLQDVAIPVTVLEAGKLESGGQFSLRDYYAKIPGLVLAPNFLSLAAINIRGITTGGVIAPTVGLVVDDVPISGSQVPTGAAILPDWDPADLSQVEVLRGPQGTLYGAGSMGGLIKFVTRDPSLEGRSGRLSVSLSSVHNGSAAGQSYRGSANVALSDSFAIRASGFWRKDPGYIDNSLRGREGVNEQRVLGGRVSTLWVPSENLTLRLAAQYQSDDWDGLNEVVVQPGLRELEQNYLPGAGAGERETQIYTASLSYDVADLQLRSVTGYVRNESMTSVDWSHVFGNQARTVFGVVGLLYRSPSDTSKLTHESRISGAIGTRADWRVGVFYTHEENPNLQIADAFDPVTGQNLGEYYRFARSAVKFNERAIFGDTTYRFTDRFDVQVGLRHSRDRTDIPEAITTGPHTMAALGRPSPVLTPGGQSEGDSTTYLITPRLKLSADMMMYGRVATGYRPGTPNTVYAPNIPLYSDPDTTTNYELGMKGAFFAKRLSVDLSVYHIDWQDIQTQARDPVSTFTFTGNGGKARSEGMELAFSLGTDRGPTVSGWVAYSDAVLTEAFPAGPAYGMPGDRLPFSPRRSGHLSLEQRFPLKANAALTASAGISYVGERFGQFTNSAARQTLPSYTRTDLQMTLDYDSWMASFFVNNLTDERGMLNGGIGYFYVPARIYITPRTYGLSIAKQF